ncbi:hypothetical protein KDN24_02440 [Bacillus sp. Bva_UNVM-123]|uniref:hypothetical protein n=1 Tax=Bacillus sp. Bva_UNVM-123 TaxID=2829798 RepID=UPI00391F5155
MKARFNTMVGKFKGLLTNERGATTLEWVGLAFVILMLMFAVSEAMSNNGDGLAQSIAGKIAELVGRVGSN